VARRAGTELAAWYCDGAGEADACFIDSSWYDVSMASELYELLGLRAEGSSGAGE
jgi:hypothetical protein